MGENRQKLSRACSGFAVKHIGTAYGGTATAAVAFTPIESFHTHSMWDMSRGCVNTQGRRSMNEVLWKQA